MFEPFVMSFSYPFNIDYHLLGILYIFKPTSEGSVELLI